jgi:POT family proton-dependent oligopeptide transporter
MWDLGLLMDLPAPAGRAGAAASRREDRRETWLERRKRELGMREPAAEDAPAVITWRAFSGGQTRLEGEAYFRFFAWLMLGTAVAFVPYAMLYRQKTYLQD